VTAHDEGKISVGCVGIRLKNNLTATWAFMLKKKFLKTFLERTCGKEVDACSNSKVVELNYWSSIFEIGEVRD